MDEPDGTDDSQPAPSAPGPSHHSAGFPLPRTNTGDFSDVDSDTDEHPAVSRTGNRAEPSFLAPPSATPSRRPSAVSLHPPLAHLEAFRAPPSENPFRRFHFDFGRRKEDDEGSVRSWDGSSVTANEHPNGTSNGQNNHFDELRSAAGSPVPDSGTAKRWKRLDGKKLWSWTKTAVPWLEWFPGA